MDNSQKQSSTVGKKIRKYRKEKDISQDRLAKMADVSFHTIVKIEKGDTPNPTVDTARKIAAALGVSVDDLLNE